MQQTFINHVNRHDLRKVFKDFDGTKEGMVDFFEVQSSNGENGDSSGSLGGAPGNSGSVTQVQVVCQCKNAINIFAPLVNHHLTPNVWIRNNWDSGKQHGYRFDPTSISAVTAARCGQVLQSLNSTKPTDATFKWLFSSVNWNIGRGGYGIKSVLMPATAFPGWGSGNLSNYHRNINIAITEISKFNPATESCDAFYVRVSAANNWDSKIDLSVLFHLVWPQFFPVHYKVNTWGYSQLRGMDQLLRELARVCTLQLQTLDYNKYGDYAAAYRVLLAIYDAYIFQNPSQPQPPHFDFLTQLLAEREGVEVEQLLLMKKSLVLYGVPGTGKTYYAQNELLQPLFGNQVHRVQFHAGYSYADFMIGIRPKTVSGALSYQVEPGLLYRLAAEAANALTSHGVNFGGGSPDGGEDDTEPKDENSERIDKRKPLCYALLIDEINRADLARVFGEVLYCIEYRGNTNTISLPHHLDPAVKNVDSVLNPGTSISDPFAGGAKFYLPENLYIVGTMNQADRSIGAFDAALRRRFAWYRMDFSAARLQQIIEYIESKVSVANPLFWQDVDAFIMRAEELNKLIERGATKPGGGDHVLPLSAEHTVGHTWFAEIINIMIRFGHQDWKMDTRHLDRLWLYFLQPMLEDALGFEAANYASHLDEMRDSFIRNL